MGARKPGSGTARIKAKRWVPEPCRKGLRDFPRAPAQAVLQQRRGEAEKLAVQG